MSAKRLVYGLFALAALWLFWSFQTLQQLQLDAAGRSSGPCSEAQKAAGDLQAFARADSREVTGEVARSQQPRQCQPWTYFLQNTSDLRSSLTVNGRKYVSGYGLAALDRLIIDSLGVLGWSRIEDAHSASAVFGLFSKEEWSDERCVHPEAAPNGPIFGTMEELLGLAHKHTLWRSVAAYFHYLDGELERANIDSSRPSGSTSAKSWNYTRMFERWRFLPRTYELGDVGQRLRLFSELPCQGKNDHVLVKDPHEHGGRGITHVGTLEEFRMRYSPADEDKCMVDKELRNLVSSLQGSKYLGLHAQRIVPSLRWEDKAMVARVFFALLRTPPPSTELKMAAKPRGGPKSPGPLPGDFEAYQFDEPYFQLHGGVVSDADAGALTRNASELDAFLGRSFVRDTFLPQVARILAVSVAASRLCPPQFKDRVPVDWTPRCPEERQIELPGSYSFFAGDFLISPSLEVVLLEYSPGMALNRIAHGASTSGIVKLLQEDSLALLLTRFNVSASPHGVVPRVSHYSLVSKRAALPHP